MTTSAAVLVSGCGGSGDSGGSKTEPSLTPQAVVDQYRAAVIAGDGEAACSFLSDEAKADVETGPEDCPTRLGAVAGQDTPEDTAALKAMHPKAIVSGTRAVANFKTIGGDPTKIVLEKQDDVWKVTDSPELVNFRISNGAS